MRQAEQQGTQVLLGARRGSSSGDLVGDITQDTEHGRAPTMLLEKAHPRLDDLLEAALAPDHGLHHGRRLPALEDLLVLRFRPRALVAREDQGEALAQYLVRPVAIQPVIGRVGGQNDPVRVRERHCLRGMLPELPQPLVGREHGTPRHSSTLPVPPTGRDEPTQARRRHHLAESAGGAAFHACDQQVLSLTCARCASTGLCVDHAIEPCSCGPNRSVAKPMAATTHQPTASEYRNADPARGTWHASGTIPTPG